MPEATWQSRDLWWQRRQMRRRFRIQFFAIMARSWRNRELGTDELIVANTSEELLAIGFSTDPDNAIFEASVDCSPRGMCKKGREWGQDGVLLVML